MKCKQPNYVYKKGINDDGTFKYGFIPGSTVVDGIEKIFKNGELEGQIEVPCGNCVACRLNYSREWANRCYLESLCHQYTWFITLTYRDDALVFGDKGLPTLEKKAISGFVRKIRDHYGHDLNIRYFGCGEYGDAQGERSGFNPHYHIILFGCPIDDLVIDMPDMSKDKLPSGMYPIFRRKNGNGDFVMFSQTIYDCWEKGKIEIEEASWNTAAYVSRYVVKKQKGMAAEIYTRLGIVPEFVRMSTKPGIGADWMLYNKEKLLQNDYLSVKNQKGVETCRPPRYFQKLMMRGTELDQDAFLGNKLNRIINAKKRCKASTSSKTDKQKRLDEAEIIEKRTKSFTRNLN